MTYSNPTPTFPPVSQADEDGLLMFDGELSVPWLLAAYRQGIYPWPIVEQGHQILSWWSPDPRSILELDDFHVSQRLQRRVGSGRYKATFDQAFEDVIRACAAPRRDDTGTWITRAIVDAYVDLHFAGHAHSVEVWRDDQLVGGLYGVALGGFFAGESMFHRERDGSKLALYYLVQRLRHRGFVLFDVQQPTAHMISMGATEIPRRRFMSRLARAIDLPVTFNDVETDKEVCQIPPLRNTLDGTDSGRTPAL